MPGIRTIVYETFEITYSTYIDGRGAPTQTVGVKPGRIQQEVRRLSYLAS